MNVEWCFYHFLAAPAAAAAAAAPAPIPAPKPKHLEEFAKEMAAMSMVGGPDRACDYMDTCTQFFKSLNLPG